MDRTDLEPISVAFIERKDAPWISNQLIRGLTHRTNNHAHTTFKPKVRCKCDPYSHGHRENMQTQYREHCLTWGFESKTTVPPVRFFYYSANSLCGHWWSVELYSECKVKVRIYNYTPVHMRRWKYSQRIVGLQILKWLWNIPKYSEIFWNVRKHLYLLSSVTIHAEEIAYFIYRRGQTFFSFPANFNLKPCVLSSNLGCTHDAAGAFIPAQGIDVTCPWDLQNTISCPRWVLILSTIHPIRWLFVLLYYHILDMWGHSPRTALLSSSIKIIWPGS